MPTTTAPIAHDTRPQHTGSGAPAGRPGPRAQSGARTGRPWRGKPSGSPRRSGAPSRGVGPGDRSGDDHEILFQKFFKSVGPRTYAAQVKRAKNGNHYLVLMEGKRDESNGEVRKTRLFIYSEDFVEFFRLIKSSAEFIKSNPLPAAVQAKREKFWARQQQGKPSRAPESSQALRSSPPTRSSPASSARSLTAPPLLQRA